MLEESKKKLLTLKELYLQIKVNPGSKTREIKEARQDGVWKINLMSSPEKNKANQELIKFLASKLEVRKDNVTIITGAKEKIKLVKITL